ARVLGACGHYGVGAASECVEVGGVVEEVGEDVVGCFVGGLVEPVGVFGDGASPGLAQDRGFEVGGGVGWGGAGGRAVGVGEPAGEPLLGVFASGLAGGAGV